MAVADRSAAGIEALRPPELAARPRLFPRWSAIAMMVAGGLACGAGLLKLVLQRYDVDSAWTYPLLAVALVGVHRGLRGRGGPRGHVGLALTLLSLAAWAVVAGDAFYQQGSRAIVEWPAAVSLWAAAAAPFGWVTLCFGWLLLGLAHARARVLPSGQRWLPLVAILPSFIVFALYVAGGYRWWTEEAAVLEGLVWLGFGAYLWWARGAELTRADP